jgi:putative addiction module component (TIGR02574 family)
MVARNFDDLLALDVASRLELITKLWDSIVADSQALPITAHERALLEERLQEDDDDPAGAIPWEIVRADLLRS